MSLPKSIKTATRNLRLLLTCCIVSTLTSPSWAQNFDAGLDRYDKGDYTGALKEWQPLVNYGNADAQFYLGLMHNYGRGVEKNDAEALSLYRKAADQGHVGAQRRMGFVYLDAMLGVERDYAEARKWLGLAARQGDQPAIEQLATLGREKDAARKVIEDAQRGDAQAQFKLALAYDGYSGRELGVHASRELGMKTRNPAEAFKWYLKAAEQGHAEAQFQVAQTYPATPAEERDMNEALKWYRRAAAQGHEKAKFHLRLAESRARGMAALKSQAKKRAEQAQKRAASQKPPAPPSPQSSARTNADAAARKDADVAMDLGMKAMQGDRLALERLRTLARQGNPGAKAILEIAETTLEITERRKR